MFFERPVVAAEPASTTSKVDPIGRGLDGRTDFTDSGDVPYTTNVDAASCASTGESCLVGNSRVRDNDDTITMMTTTTANLHVVRERGGIGCAAGKRNGDGTFSVVTGAAVARPVFV